MKVIKMIMLILLLIGFFDSLEKIIDDANAKNFILFAVIVITMLVIMATI